MKRALGETLALLLLAAVAGLLSGSMRRPPLPSRLPDAFFAVESGARPILVEQARAFLERGGIVFVDARTAAAFTEEHVAGAISLPAQAWEEKLGSAAEWMEGAPLVLYGARRELLQVDNLAAQLRRQGFGPVSVMVEGFEGWTARGLPCERGRAANDEGSAPDSGAGGDGGD